MLQQQFKQIGEKLFSRGLNNSHSGNISVRQNDKIIISKTGKMLDELNTEDLIEVGMQPDAELDKIASMELLVHRAIYQADPKLTAVVHAHAPHAVVLADNKDAIVPYDQEGCFFFDKIPVMQVAKCIASAEVAGKIGEYVKTACAVIVAKHGVFAWGENLEAAYHYLMVVDSATRVNYLLERR